MIWVYMLFINILGFIIMKIDKQKAVKGRYRIPERTIWLLACIGGASGTAAGMFTFRHKTKHLNFRVILPFLSVLQIIVFAYVLMQFN